MPHGFELSESRPLPALRSEASWWIHPSGARHLHIANDDPHRSFCVGFRTSPEDSTGLPHILEHTALCGSERFPVRDPFFMMLRRSLQTFMNAMTYPDRTCYPFATQVAKDFDNLLDIYLDAAFAPRLDELDFDQEGWRLAPADDPADGWAIKGVVYNEMKGAMSDTDSQVFDAICRTMLPDTCYRHNSGGDPRAIPALSHADLVAFHRRTYGAANACFTTFGNCDLDDLHQRFDAVCRSCPGQVVALPELQESVRVAAEVSVPVPLADGQDPREVTAPTLVWAWGDTATVSETLSGECCDHLLFGSPAAPLRLALERSGLGRSCSDSGYMAYLRNGLFTIELRGMAPEDQGKLPGLVMPVLEQVAESGFDPADVDAALHQIELRRRHIGGDGMPFGLQLGLRALGAWCCDGDVLASIDQESALGELADTVRAPGFWQRFIRERFLDNQHRSFFTTQPDATFHQSQEEAERRDVEERVAAASPETLNALRDASEALEARQAEEDDPEILPDLELADIPAERFWADGPWHDGVRRFSAGTNGMVHLWAAIPAGDLAEADIDLLSTLSGLIGRLGFDDNSYTDTARLLDQTCGGVSSHLELSADSDSTSGCRAWLVLGIRGLAGRVDDFAGLLPRILSGQRFDETERMAELLAEGISALQDQVLGSGHAFAVMAAQRGLPGRAGLSHRISGLGRLAWLKGLKEQADADDAALQELSARLADLLSRLRSRPMALAIAGDRIDDVAISDALLTPWQGFRLDQDAARQLSVLNVGGQETAAGSGFTTATPVNYHARVYRAVPIEHPDAAALAVACRLLSQQQLHRRIREQGGAYGSNATFSPGSGTIALSSYRDPRFGGTFSDFDESIAWLLEAPEDERLLKEAILAIIAGIDNPGSPAGEANRRFQADNIGHGPAVVDRYRSQVIGTSIGDVRRVAQTWLQGVPCTEASITDKDRLANERPDWEALAL